MSVYDQVTQGGYRRASGGRPETGVDRRWTGLTRSLTIITGSRPTPLTRSLTRPTRTCHCLTLTLTPGLTGFWTDSSDSSDSSDWDLQPDSAPAGGPDSSGCWLDSSDLPDSAFGICTAVTGK
jgi:hypothetical protein